MTAQTDTIFFNKAMWIKNSDYRYEIAKSDHFPNVTELSKEEVIEILGKPDIIENKRLIYCLDIIKYNNEKTSDEIPPCTGAFIIIDFESDKRWKLTFMWTE